MLKKIAMTIGLMFCLILPLSATEDPMERLNNLTNKRLLLVHPELRSKFWIIKKIMERAFPQYKVQVTTTYRTCKEQTDLYGHGRDRYGNIDKDPKTRIVTNAKCNGGAKHLYFGQWMCCLTAKMVSRSGTT